MEDDLFQSLGGSLMKDLLADLQGDEGDGDGWLSLEQLEKELSTLDDGGASGNAPVSIASLSMPPLPEHPTSAASMVVTGQQQFLQQQAQQPQTQPQAVHGVGLLGDVTVTTAPADAWKESLQKFTALSLAGDFLAADSVRKQQQTAVPPPAKLPPGFMAEAEDYDATEKATVKPPPGLADGTPGEIPEEEEEDDKKREEQARIAAASLLPRAAAPPPIPARTGMPKTPANSSVVDLPPRTPRNSVVVQSAQAAASVKRKASGGIEQDVPTMGSVQILKKESTQHVAKTQPSSQQVELAGSRGQGPPQGMPMMPYGVPMMNQPQGMPVHPGMHPGMHPPMQMTGPHQGFPVGLPALGGPAWQSGPRPLPPQPMKIFCNPLPNAPPVPAQILESRYMKSRDIAYIIHSIMKPVLMSGISEHDYDIQLLHRQSGGRPAGPRPRPQQNHNNKVSKNKKQDDIDPTLDALSREMLIREKKTKEWAAKKSALGVLPKSNVARPRALIASPVISQATKENSESASEQKQRARLWKARIYCDQAYQAYLDVMDIWAKAKPGTVPPQVHAPLIRLMKCLGLTGGSAPLEDDKAGSMPGKEYKVDAQVLQLFLKLSKGRTLFARIVEQALLPPSAIQAVMPASMDYLYNNIPLTGDGSNGMTGEPLGDITDDRCFRAISGVIRTLPSLSGESILQSAEVMKANAEAALSSTSRMECLHALLQRGNDMSSSSNSASDDFKTHWKETETAFLNILTGM